VLRTLTAIVGSLLGAVVSWQLGDLLGTPALRAVGAAFVWPVATSAALFAGALLPFSSSRLQSTVRTEPEP
jgi:predicted lysophospholipase L1 biosynthesis ABC-type transport system permease subunit